jgi:ubiquinone/menaquinone biosynthesis C-methylase UbiE/DNA-binding transcriptional ArsR family regulator
MAGLTQLVEVLRAVGEPTRLRILALLSRAELTVTELTTILRQSQPRVSRHLKLLTDAGVIDRAREGAWVFYRAREVGEIAEVKAALLKHLPDRDVMIFRDLERLDAVQAQRAGVAQKYFAANAQEWDRLRALHVAESEVEDAMVSLLDGRHFAHHLDIGTGTGRILELLSPLAERSLGVDLSPEMLSIARARIADADLRRVQVRLGDLFELPAADGSFDLITIHQVLHFLQDPGRAVAEAARVLKPGGSLLIADFAPHQIESLRDAHQHRRLGFDAREVQSWLDIAKLQLQAVRHLPPAGGQGLTVSLWLGQSPNAHAATHSEREMA